ncbi:methionyl-tRNA formyltransferase [Paenibacillus ginsengarvi]|uniref:Methionyl-tRNA formyltransferase n=1 Tax=Paenibacillus ginsengarvi TaxID=400777 RepID=A0A3B0CLS7_9BACL|nr:methionyl-tRNA formyltransferase [Paenibacillus ginsengarvi]RKN86625.1 methionyl-tRNA formyltransferase [Paenibacillus ginsengarvi]
MNVVFMGTPDFAVPSLRTLLDGGYNVVAVVTQPDRPKGRKRELTPPPVKAEAMKHGIPVLQPEKLRDPGAVDSIRDYAPDLIVTAAYGQILPKSLLALPKFGCINVHGSLLPKYRGGAPIQHAVMNGEAETGVTIMYMAAGLDTGDMISRTQVPITDEDTAGTLFDTLSAAGADLLRRTLPDLLEGRLTAVPQNEAEATYAPNISRDNERIDWSRPSLAIFNQIRGLNPMPGAFTLWNGEVFKVWASRKPALATGASAEAPGTVLQMTDDGLQVRTGDGSLWLTQVQPAGKKAMSVSDLKRGTLIPPGTVLGVEPS